MASSSEAARNKKIISSRHDDHALMPSPDMLRSKNYVQENKERPTESPPTPTISYTSDSGQNSCSPNNVMNADGSSFRDCEAGTSRSEKSDEHNRVGKDTSSSVYVSESTLDTSSGKNDLPTNLVLRARTRAASKPARFRLPVGVETSTAIPIKPNKKESTKGDRKKSIANAARSSTKGGKIAQGRKNSMTAGTWTEKEQKQFEDGCIKFGWGNWCAIEDCIPTRTRNQVKSHAQKFQKHHPGEKIRLEREHKQLDKKKGIAKNNNAGAKKRKAQQAAASPVETTPKSKKRSKPLEAAALRKPARASKRAQPMKEVSTSPVREAGILVVSAAAEPHEEKRPVSDVRKCSQAPARKDGNPGTGAWTFQEQEQFKDGCILHGWGNWRGIESCVPTRTNAQVKSHAQKFQKHHPEEKERIDMEHKWRSQLIQKNALANKAGVHTKKRLAAKRSPPTDNNKETAQGNGIASRSSWSFTEQKQFEDGCILQGWGNWSGVANHIPTRNRSQVRSHAQKYQTLTPKKRERLENEHKRHYLQAGGETSVKNTLAKDTKVHHVLLGVGKSPGKKDKVELDGKTIGSPSHVQSPSQGSTHKTTDDDFGAAEAILALNSAKWDDGKNGMEAESPCSEDIAHKESSNTSPCTANGSMGKNGGDVYASVESNKVEDGAIREIGSEETSSVTTSHTEEAVLRTSDDVDVRLDSRNVDNESVEFDKAVAAELNHGDELTPNDPNPAARNINPTGREGDSPTTPKRAPIRLNTTNTSSQPPPHWLAADTWGECLGKIQLWHNELSEEEHNVEYQKYDRLPGREKERFRQKLLILMDNRPPTRPASD